MRRKSHACAATDVRIGWPCSEERILREMDRGFHNEAEIRRRQFNRENRAGVAPAVWQAPRPESQLEKKAYLSFFGGLSSFGGFAGGFGAVFFSVSCCCLSLAASASCFLSSPSSCC